MSFTCVLVPTTEDVTRGARKRIEEMRNFDALSSQASSEVSFEMMVAQLDHLPVSFNSSGVYFDALKICISIHFICTVQIIHQ